MYMINGRTRQVGRDDGRSLGFYGTGRLGDVTCPKNADCASVSFLPANPAYPANDPNAGPIVLPGGQQIVISTDAPLTGSGDSITLDTSQGYLVAPGAPGSGSSVVTTGGMPGFNTPIVGANGANVPTVSSSSFPSWMIYALAAVAVLAVMKR